MVRRAAFFLMMAAAGVVGFAAGPAASAPATPGAATQGAATEAASSFYAEVMKDYMEGHFDALETAFKEHAAELAGLSKEERADVDLIRLALKEGRPDWWAITKKGAKATITPLIAGRKITVTFDPGGRNGPSVKLVKGVQAMSVLWVSADMDGKTLMGVKAGNDVTSFTNGDLVSLQAFSNLATVDALSQLPVGDEIVRDRYGELRGKLAGMALGTPPARRYGMMLCLRSFTEATPKPATRMAQRAVGEMLICDLLEHPENYPSIELPKNLTAGREEETLGLGLADWVGMHPWTFAEDNLIRQSLKQFAVANGPAVFLTNVVTLPNKLTMSLDPRKDEALVGERNAWIKREIARLPGGAK